MERYCPDLDHFSYRIWRDLQPAILTLSYFGGLYFGLAAFFWLGAIRLVFSLHAQRFVNSVCHSEPDTAFGEDSSRNVRWLAFMHFFQGENWHRNHHARPGIARLGWAWHQPHVGYSVICILEMMGLVSEVRRIRHVESRKAIEARPRTWCSSDHRLGRWLYSEVSVWPRTRGRSIVSHDTALREPVVRSLRARSARAAICRGSIKHRNCAR